MFDHIIGIVHKRKPLIHSITNYVSMNDCANILLACGGAAIMAEDTLEVRQITAICDGLNLNIGMLNENKLEAMLVAGRSAAALHHPVVLDPVGAGASDFRNSAALRIIKEISPTVIRGNISEIKALAVGMADINHSKGVEANDIDRITEDNIYDVAAFALDYENPDTLDMPLIRQCLSDLSTTGKTVLPIYDFTTESRSSETETLDLKGGVCIVEGIHALNPELTGLVKGDDVYRIYAGLREEYCIDGRRVINTQDIRLCRRTLRDAAARGRSPAKTLAMWDRVLDGETRYIKGFKTTADFLLDTSFTYELGLIAKLLRPVSQRFTLEGHNAELWDETARRFEHVAPVELELLPADSMLREFYAGEV